MRAQQMIQREIITGKLLEVRGVALISEQLDVIILVEWRLAGKRAGFFVCGSEFARDNFAGLDVWLIEGINSQNRTGDSCGDLPAKEFLAKVVDVSNFNFDNRLSGLAERSKL